MDDVVLIEKPLNWTDDFSKKKEAKNSDLKSFSLSIVFHTALVVMVLLGFNSLSTSFTEKPRSPIKAMLYVPVIQKETNAETLLSSQNQSEIALSIKRPIQPANRKIMESTQIPVTSSENTRNVDSALVVQSKIEKNVQFDSLEAEHDNQFRFEVDSNIPSNEQEIKVDIFATKASKDLGTFSQKAFETMMRHDIRVIEKQNVSPDLDIPLKAYRDDDHEILEKLAITVDCNSMKGGILTRVSRLLNGTFGTNQNSQLVSAHNSATSVDRIRCSKKDIDQFIQRRLNTAQD